MSSSKASDPADPLQLFNVLATETPLVHRNSATKSVLAMSMWVFSCHSLQPVLSQLVQLLTVGSMTVATGFMGRCDNILKVGGDDVI